MLQDETSKTILPQHQRSGRPYLVNKLETITPWASNLIRPQLLKPIALTTTEQSFAKNMNKPLHVNSKE